MADINVVDPQGNLGSIAQEQLPDATQAGYRPATSEDILRYQKQQKFGTLGQTLGAAAEGISRGVLGPVGPALESSLQVAPGQPLFPPEEQLARREKHPVASTLGEITGLTGSMLTGQGLGALVSRAGEAAVPAALNGTSALSKIGSLAAKGAVENALVQSGDEVSRMILKDPNQSAETAAIDIGLSGVLGGALGAGFGAISPLWKATTGSRLGQALELIKNKVNGSPIDIAPDLADSLSHTGIEIPDALKPIISNDPELVRLHQQLIDSRTAPGLEYQDILNDFKNKISQNVLDSTGKNLEDIPTDLSKFEAGQELQKDLSKSIQERFDPLTEKYEAIQNKLKDIPLQDGIKGQIADNLQNVIKNERYNIDPDSAQFKTVQNAIEKIQNVETLDDLRKFKSLIGQNTYDPLNTKGLNRTGQLINNVLNDADERLVNDVYGAKGPKFLQEVKDANTSYKGARQFLDDLNDRLRIGNFGGAKSFINGLKEMKPEEVFNRLTNANDAGLIDLLQKNLPEMAETIKDHQLNKILAPAVLRAKGEAPIDVATFMKNYNKISPEMKNFILPQESNLKIQGASKINQFLNSIPRNYSNTAPTLIDKLSQLPAGAGAAISWMTGHNPAMGLILGQTAKWLSLDAPDAIRLAYLKWLGHQGPINPSAFSKMVDFIHSNIKSETILNRATKDLFKAGKEVLPRSQLPNDKDVKKLDTHIKTMNADNGKLLGVGGDFGYYMPEHNTALSSVASNAVQYLNSIRPSVDKPGLLDKPREPSVSEKEDYSRSLNIAEQPLNIFNHIKDGTLNTKDMTTLKTIYPNLYNRMSEKLINELTENMSKNTEIPYKTKLSLSLFLGQPLEYTMGQQGIQTSQLANMPMQTPQMPQKSPRGSKQALNKLPGMYQTVNEARSEKKIES